MSLATDVAIGAAERLELTAGPGPGLALFRRLASTATTPELLGRAILGGLRCATQLRDVRALADLSRLWATVEVASAAVQEGLFAGLKALSRAGLLAAAVDLAHAELRRAPCGRARYAYARCLDVARDARAPAAFLEVIERASSPGESGRVRAARVRRAAWLARAPSSLREAIEEAKRVAPEEATAAERLLLASILLRAPSRFVRAGALGLLDELVAGARDPGVDRAATREGGLSALARTALVVAARHADDQSDDLTPLEADRVLAILSREPVAKEVARARETVAILARLARAREAKDEGMFERALDDAARLAPELGELHRRAREILQGRFEPWEEGASGSRPVWSTLLSLVVALRDAAKPRAAHALGLLSDQAERGEALPPLAWSVATVALGSDDAEVRRCAARLVAAMLPRSSARPPRGWLPLAHALAACESGELATIARRAAALAGEPGAREALLLALTRAGWSLAAKGEREQAIARLREARDLATEGSAPVATVAAATPAAT